MLDLNHSHLDHIFGFKFKFTQFTCKDGEILANLSELQNGVHLLKNTPDQILILDIAGEHALFFLEEEQEQRDPQYRFWTFKPSHSTVEFMPFLKHTYVTILDDGGEE